MTIEEIKTQCRTCIELGNKATVGPWEARGEEMNSIYIHSRMSIIAKVGDTSVYWTNYPDHDSDHIAHARTFSPAAAKALLRALEWLETPRAPKKCPFCTEAEPCGSCYTLACEDGVREAELAAICAQFDP